MVHSTSFYDEIIEKNIFREFSKTRNFGNYLEKFENFDF